MSGKLLIILVVIVLALYAAGLAIGMNQPKKSGGARSNRDHALTHLADSLFGWAAPGFDLEDLSIDGKQATRSMRIEPGRTYRLAIVASESESRRLTMSFESGVTAIWARTLDDVKTPAVYFVYEAKQALPSEMTDEFPSPRKTMIPNPDQDDAQRKSTYDWPILEKGAVITVRSSLDRATTVEIK